MLRAALALLPLAGALALAGCGSATEERAGARPTVFAASSLKEVLPAILGDATYAFAGSDALALQIREGARADLFLAASPRYPEELADEGLCDAPVGFASNTLALLVPADNPAGIGGVDDLLDGGPYRLAVGDPNVPIGAYTREALAKLGADDVLVRNTVSEEPDASSLVAKVALGSADVAIAYTTDAARGDGDLGAIPLPAEAEPTVAYMACVVRRDGGDAQAARSLLDHLLAENGQAALGKAGFGPAP